MVKLSWVGFKKGSRERKRQPSLLHPCCRDPEPGCFCCLMRPGPRAGENRKLRRAKCGGDRMFTRPQGTSFESSNLSFSSERGGSFSLTEATIRTTQSMGLRNHRAGTRARAMVVAPACLLPFPWLQGPQLRKPWDILT